MITLHYDPQGNLFAVTDPEQNLKPSADRMKTSFTYNAFGKPLTTTDSLGNPTTHAYHHTVSTNRSWFQWNE
jgi:YD repeat-containing protein